MSKWKPAKELPAITDLTLQDRMMTRLKVDKVSECWEWQGCTHHNNGYGQIKWKGAVRQVHRIAYAIFKGMIPAGITVEHLCKNRRCCNPDHLVLMTHNENCKRK